MPIAAYIAERSQILAMLGVTICIGIFGMAFAPLFLGGPTSVTWMFCISMCLMGLTYGPLSTLLADLFPPPVRYTGCSLCYRLGAILGASMAPYTAQWLAEHHGLNAVGTYISLSSAVTIIGLLLAQFLQSSEPSTLYHDDPVSDVA